VPNNDIVMRQIFIISRSLGGFLPTMAYIRSKFVDKKNLFTKHNPWGDTNWPLWCRDTRKKCGEKKEVSKSLKDLLLVSEMWIESALRFEKLLTFGP